MSKRLDELETASIDAKIKEAFIEHKKHDNRKLKIMCFGLPESEEETTEARNAEDSKTNYEYCYIRDGTRRTWENLVKADHFVLVLTR